MCIPALHLSVRVAVRSCFLSAENPSSFERALAQSEFLLNVIKCSAKSPLSFESMLLKLHGCSGRQGSAVQ